MKTYICQGLLKKEWNVFASQAQVSFGDNENVLEFDSDNGSLCK